MATTTITRRTTLGYGYNAGCEQVWNSNYTHSWLSPVTPTKPYHVGTVKTVGEKIQHDRTLRSFDSGGTCYVQAWFVKVSGQWHKITDSGPAKRSAT